MAHSERRASSEAPPEGVTAAAEPAPAQSVSAPSAKGAAAPRTAGPEAETAPAATGAVSAVPDEESSPAARAAEPDGSGEVAAAGGVSPPTVTSTESSGGGPSKPILAGAAIAGALLVAVPLMLVAGRSDPASHGSAVAAEAAATMLQDGTEVQNPGEFVPAPPAPTQSQAATRAKSQAGVPTAGAHGSTSPTRRQIASPGGEAVQKKRPLPKTETSKKHASVPAMGTGRDATFLAGSKLCVNQAWTSYDGRTVLRLQADRNLVLYRDGSAVWAAPGAWRRGDCAVLQTDGNFVLHNANHQPIWASGTWGGPTYLTVQDDGNMCLYGRDNSAVWATNTNR